MGVLPLTRCTDLLGKPKIIETKQVYFIDFNITISIFTTSNRVRCTVW